MHFWIMDMFTVHTVSKLPIGRTYCAQRTQLTAIKLKCIRSPISSSVLSFQYNVYLQPDNVEVLRVGWSSLNSIELQNRFNNSSTTSTEFNESSTDFQSTLIHFRVHWKIVELPLNSFELTSSSTNFQRTSNGVQIKM